MAIVGNDRFGLWLRARILCAIIALVSSCAQSMGQQAFVVPAGVSPEQAKAMAEAQAKAGGHPAPGGEQPKSDDKDKKEGDDKKKEGDDKDKKKDDDSTVKRPEKPPRVPDPRELDVKLDDKGRVPAFAFIGQPWPDVLQWLASISNRSLDWQELPNDYLNLTTQQSYPLDDVRDLINRHLHARGYTLLEGGEVLSVFKIEKLDPSLVPRVSEDELYDRKPYDFVKVSYQLPEDMVVDKAKDDIKQVLSPQAKVFPMVTTKRLLVIDAVANQRLVSGLLNEERLHADGVERPRVFKLRYSRAEKVVDAIYVLFGLDPKSRPTQMELQVQQQQLQLMTQMQQQGKDVTSMLKKDGPPIYLAVNRQTNSVLANAPPEYMRTIAKAVEALDVPNGDAGEAISGMEGPAGGDIRLEKYQLVSMDPGALKMSLEEIGDLDPQTQLQADPRSKILFARATEADHRKIAAMKDQLDGTGRQLKVIWLPKRLPADALAGSIYSLMNGQQEDDNQPRYPFFFFGGRSQNEEPKKGFRVDADIENNRLLLWANEAELEQVQQFLGELTKDPSGRGGSQPVRIIAPVDDQETARLLDQLRRAWPGLGENELIIDDQRVLKKQDDEKSAPPPKTEPAKEPDKDQSASNEAPRARKWRLDKITGVPTTFAQFRLVADQESADAVNSAPPQPTSAVKSDLTSKRPPVTITVTPDGRLVIASQDSAALDRLEGFADELLPPANRFKIFRLDYIKAYDVYVNLAEYYEDELKSAAKQQNGFPFFFDFQSEDKKEEPAKMSTRRKLRIIYDPPSNSILVANASANQLQEIEQLIKEYDQPASSDSTKMRRNGAIKINYSKASTIATAIKDVYRDLLSSKDKEFDSKDKKQQGTTRESVTVIRYGASSEAGGPKKTAPMKIGFEGALSIGVDDTANMLIVSAQEEIYESVVEMIRRLDDEARPRTTIQVHRVNGQIDPKSLQKALSETIGTPWPGGRPEKKVTEADGDKKPKDKEAKPDGEAKENGKE